MNEVKVIYEDSDLLVIDKPSGITVNKSDTTTDEFTVQDYIEKYLVFSFANREVDKETDYYKRAGIVHRIDKETSGILVIAKNPESFENLQLQFKKRMVEKTYIALVHGLVSPDEGEISVPVGRLPWNRKRFGVLAGGKEASTKYRVLKKFPKPFTLLELNPKTGRTHQIRVHLKYFNHPIFADSFYAGRKTSRIDRRILQRVFLHAIKISFIHPGSGQRLEFQSEIPLELTNIIKSLER